jgi:ATP adenylyltransferase
VTLEQLWAGWRAEYLRRITEDDRTIRPDGQGSLFERILSLSDEEGLVVHRGAGVATLLNAYPYANGHLLVLPARAAADLVELDDDVSRALWAEQCAAVEALRAAYSCAGVNVGMNLGRAAGAGVPDHLHVHVVPRWEGDTNFMTAVAGARVLPEPLDLTWRRVRDAWPGAPTPR